MDEDTELPESYRRGITSQDEYSRYLPLTV